MADTTQQRKQTQSDIVGKLVAAINAGGALDPKFVAEKLQAFALNYYEPDARSSQTAAINTQVSPRIESLSKATTEDQKRAGWHSIFAMMAGHSVDPAIKTYLEQVRDLLDSDPAKRATVDKAASENARAIAANAVKKTLAAPAAPAPDKPKETPDADRTELSALDAELKKKKEELGKLEKEEKQKEAAKKKQTEIKIVEARIRLMNARIALRANPQDANLQKAVRTAEQDLKTLEEGSSSGFQKWLNETWESLKNGNFSIGKIITALIAAVFGYSVVGNIFGGGGALGMVLGIGVAIAAAFGGAALFDNLFGGPDSKKADAGGAPGQGQGQSKVITISPNIFRDIVYSITTRNPNHRDDILELRQDGNGKWQVMTFDKGPIDDARKYLISAKVLKQYVDRGQLNISVDEIVAASKADVDAARKAGAPARTPAPGTQQAGVDPAIAGQVRLATASLGNTPQLAAGDSPYSFVPPRPSLVVASR